MKKVIYTACLTTFAALLVVLVVYLLCLANEKQMSQKLEEKEGSPSAQDALRQGNWKEYDSIVKIWPRLKEEKIESITIRYAFSPEYGDDIESDFEKNVNTFGYRERAAEDIRWWPTAIRVPKEKLSECIEVIDKLLKEKEASGIYIPTESPAKMLIVTSKVNYIFPEEAWNSVDRELGKFLRKYCKPSHEHWYALSPKEQTVAIAIFSHRHPKDRLDSELFWPPIALFGDKKEAEKLLGRSFEPKTIFEGRDWLEKIITEYEIALKDAEKEHYRRGDSSALKGYIVFLTQEEFYWKAIGINDNTVIGEHIKGSKELKKYFDELGLTKELLAGEPNKEN
jgi:hypothetical protein